MAIYHWLQLKRKLEEYIMWPFIQWGRWQAKKNPLSQDYDLFAFVPDFALGGAEKVHAEVLACFPDKQIMLFFTRRSANDKMLHLFQQSQVQFEDISRWTDNKAAYWQNLIWRGRCAAYINVQQKKPVIFNGQCNFAYKLLPHLRKDILNGELIHVSERRFSQITFPYLPFIGKRVMVADQIIKEISSYYKEIGAPAELEKRIVKIFYKCDIPETLPARTYEGALKVYYAGRGGYQKRIHLIVAVARACYRLQLPVEFHFAGDISHELPEDLLAFSTYHGKIEGGAAMNRFHQQMDILLMTSLFEGFPLLIMEAMSNGVLPVSTAVSGIPEHIHSGENGFLLTATEEDEIVQQAVDVLKKLCSNREQLRQLAASARQYAASHFSSEQFCKAYRTLLFPDKDANP